MDAPVPLAGPAAVEPGVQPGEQPADAREPRQHLLKLSLRLQKQGRRVPPTNRREELCTK